MAKKVYIEIESESPFRTLDSTLDMLQGEEGVTFAKGRVGRGGNTQVRRYELEKLFTGPQPEDFRRTRAKARNQ